MIILRIVLYRYVLYLAYIWPSVEKNVNSVWYISTIIPVFLFTTSTFYQKNKEKKSNFLSIRNPRLISLFFVCEKMTVHQYRFEYFHLFFLNISRRHDILRVTKQFANFSESCRDGVTWQAQ